MLEEATCGHGIAEHGAFHQRVADLLAAIQQNLELHLTSLDPNDEVSKPEYAAYSTLVQQHHELVPRFRFLADVMKSYHDLPMANHDPAVLGSDPVIEAFRLLVRRQEELLELLSDWVTRDRNLLDHL